METLESVAQPPSAVVRQKLEFTYGFQGRRIEKKIYTWGSGSNSYSLTASRKFVYDGWNLIAELTAQNTPVRTYLWGQDLSGTMQGAGGVGGLLMVNNVTDNSTHFPAFDGNGNVMALVNADTGAVSAQYEYGPFGEPLRATGPMAKANPFRFSTKYTDGETGLVYYNYRYLNASTGRWLSRDPISEYASRSLNFRSSALISRISRKRSDQNEYLYVKNRTVNGYDILGLQGESLDTEGQWEIYISPDQRKEQRDVVAAIYRLSDKEKACCKKAKLDRYVMHRLPLWFPVRGQLSTIDR